MMKLRGCAGAILLSFVAIAAFGKTWFDSYDEGIRAVRSKNWSVAAQKMSEAIAQNPKEDGKARPYGNIFVKYYPYYYRGIANFNLGRYDDAIRDLKKTEGVGEIDLGSADEFVDRAQSKLSTPTIQTTTRDTTTTAHTTTTNPPPGPDPAIVAARSRAEQIIAGAQRKRTAAQQQRAETYAAQEFAEGDQLLLDAQRRVATASRAGDWNQAADAADRAGRTFDAAITEARMQIEKQNKLPIKIADEVLAETKKHLRDALQDYFAGDFDRASSKFDRLTKEQSQNAMLWAFLGASQFYRYYLDGSIDVNARAAAERSFRRARQIKPNLDLPPKYFSPRVRRFYAAVR